MEMKGIAGRKQLTGKTKSKVINYVLYSLGKLRGGGGGGGIQLRERQTDRDRETTLNPPLGKKCFKKVFHYYYYFKMTGSTRIKLIPPPIPLYPQGVTTFSARKAEKTSHARIQHFQTFSR